MATQSFLATCLLLLSSSDGFSVRPIMRSTPGQFSNLHSRMIRRRDRMAPMHALPTINDEDAITDREATLKIEKETPLYNQLNTIDEKDDEESLFFEEPTVFYPFDSTTDDMPPLELSNDRGTLEQMPAKKESNIGEVAGLAVWMGLLSAFLLINNYVGPFPEGISSVPVKTWGLMHGIAGMLFGGGIITTTCLEWLVANSKKEQIMKFWFSKVPQLDAFIVLPAVTAAIISGTALSVDHYGSLSDAPFHVTAALGTLLAFAGWWGLTDVTTQSKANEAVQQWTENKPFPEILNFRKISNVVSCGFVAALYAIMILKPGFEG